MVVEKPVDNVNKVVHKWSKKEISTISNFEKKEKNQLFGEKRRN
jgi:hypothetical protein